jgi:hypothetical protein
LPESTADDRQRAKQDSLVTDYRTILAELALLTTVSVLLFGFLLASASAAESGLQEWIYSAAVVMVASATMVFILPVVYHHVQFPYEDFEKFQLRSHFWIVAGSPLLGCGLYLSLCLAIWALFDAVALVIAALPILAAVIVFVLRKGQL